MDWAGLLIKNGFTVPSDTSEFNILCPFHEDSVPSCAINVDKGVWVCFRGCGQGSLKLFFHKYLKTPWNELDEQFEEFEWSLDIFDDFGSEETPLESVPVELPEGKSPSDSHWIFKRGFKRDVLADFGCIVNKYGDLVIPVNDINGELKGYICRRQNATPRYMYSPGFRKSTVLFGADLLWPTECVYVTEGALDAMWLYQHVYPAVAVLGAHVSREQIRVLSKISPAEVVLCLDNDEAGQIGIAKALVDMSNNYMVSYVTLPNNYKDVQEIHNGKILEKTLKKKEIF